MVGVGGGGSKQSFNPIKRGTEKDCPIGILENIICWIFMQ